LLEKAGVPTVSIVTAPFRVTGTAMARQWGVEDYAFVDMPHPIANLTEDELDQRVDDLLNDVVRLLLEERLG
jgi:hypothetical protein